MDPDFSFGAIEHGKVRRFDRLSANGVIFGRKHFRPALRRRRDRRRAQCGQIHAGKRAGGAEGGDHQSQGADHPHSCHGRGDRRRRAGRAGRHARHLRAAPAARPGDGAGRLGRRAGRGPHRACGRWQGGPWPQDGADHRGARSSPGAQMADPQQGRYRHQGKAAGPHSEAL